MQARTKCECLLFDVQYLVIYSTYWLTSVRHSAVKQRACQFYHLLAECVVPKEKYPYISPHGGHFCFRPPTPCNFYPSRCLSYPPPLLPGISAIFQLGWVLPEKNISVQYFQCLLLFWLFYNCWDRLVLNVWQSLESHLTIDYAQSLFFSWSVDQNARDTNYHERD